MQGDREKQLEYNLSVLKRRDANITGIQGTAGHVVLYQFNEESKAWDRKGVEGSLFVVERTSMPKYQFVVLNRLSSENLVETIDENLQIELTEQFLLYRNSNQEILGVWFYSAPERTTITELLGRLSKAPAAPNGADDEPLLAPAEPIAAAAGGSDAELSVAHYGKVEPKVAQLFNLVATSTTGAAPTPPPALAALPPASVPAPPATKSPMDTESLKVKLATQLRGLLDDDTFLSMLANEYLRQQQRAVAQVRVRLVPAPPHTLTSRTHLASTLTTHTLTIPSAHTSGANLAAACRVCHCPCSQARQQK